MYTAGYYYCIAPCWWPAPSLRQNRSMTEIAKIDQKTIRLYFQEGQGRYIDIADRYRSRNLPLNITIDHKYKKVDYLDRKHIVLVSVQSSNTPNNKNLRSV